MNYKDIINDIKNRNIKNTYLFYGKEYYLIENAIKEIIEKVGAKDSKDLGKVMGAAKSLNAVATGKRISDMAKKLLQ